MRRRATIIRSSGSATRAKMDASLAFFVLFVAGSAVAYNDVREAPYNIGPNDPYSAEVNHNFQDQRSQRLFWGNQGSNQVGGTGLWASLTNKFPILGNMFGRMEQLPTQYGVPSTQYGAPGYQNQVPQLYQQPLQQSYQPPQFYQQPQKTYQQPQQFYQQPQQSYQQPRQFYQQPQQSYQQPQQSYQQPQQFYQQPQFYQSPQQIGQRFVPSVRDVGLTDDAVIVTPPFVPVSEPQPAPAPFPQPAPAPDNQGYQYNKPQYRLDLPHK